LHPGWVPEDRVVSQLGLDRDGAEGGTELVDGVLRRIAPNAQRLASLIRKGQPDAVVVISPPPKFKDLRASAPWRSA
jgi:hypothetical protein